ncbi:hypothetical protein QE432_003440 [Agrobacterium sp. SORGH_AS 745]|nr:hypothetical protein [Agrobacterium tumefaciens]MDQ1221859.1 hypothetical protein [Agrobacterium sp. SORGH_AS_0745]
MDFNGLWILGSKLMMTEDRFSRVTTSGIAAK